MHIGVPRETGPHERRVGLTPWAAGHLVRLGHTVVVEKGAGAGARFTDDEYAAAGATVVYSREEAFKRADVVLCVTLLRGDDLDLLRPESVLCGFHHLSVAPRAVVERLCGLRMTTIGYELVEDAEGRRPLLIPMSEMAGEMAVYVAGHYLQNEEGGLIGSMAMIGALTAGLFGRWVVRTGERILNRMPIIRSVYGAIKQIFETVLAQQSRAFREVVLVEFPRREAWTIGFVTARTQGEIARLMPNDLLTLYVPTTPNVTGGYMLFVPRKDVVPLSMSVEDAWKLVISIGIVTPPDRLVPPSPGPQQPDGRIALKEVE